jgi:hypothetical protein
MRISRKFLRRLLITGGLAAASAIVQLLQEQVIASDQEAPAPAVAASDAAS